MTVLGDVGRPVGSPVSLDYGFGRPSIGSGGRLYYWSGALTQVTDPDLGDVIDQIWADGYYMTTDGDSLVVTKLNDPTRVNPIKYGSSEVDPDPILGLARIREVYAANRNTIEVFDNIGGEFFPFQRIDGAQIPKGVIGTHAMCIYVDALAFVGSGRNEAPGVYIGSNGTASKISTASIDDILAGYSEAQLAQTVCEARNDNNHQHLYVHLLDRTLVYDAAASQELQEPVWFVLVSATANFAQYRGRYFVWMGEGWTVADTQSGAVGVVDKTVSSHWGSIVRWEFGTTLIYNEGRGAIFNQLELVPLAGGVGLGVEPKISTSYTLDGQNWSQSRTISGGKIGQSNKRLVWFRQGFMRNWRAQRFTGDSQAHLAFCRLEAQLEPLGV